MDPSKLQVIGIGAILVILAMCWCLVALEAKIKLLAKGVAQKNNAQDSAVNRLARRVQNIEHLANDLNKIVTDITTVKKVDIPIIATDLKDLQGMPTAHLEEDDIIGKSVTVYDRFRFAIPVQGIIIKQSESNDSVGVRLTTSNSIKNPVGSCIWVHLHQLKFKEK